MAETPTERPGSADDLADVMGRLDPDPLDPDPLDPDRSNPEVAPDTRTRAATVRRRPRGARGASPSATLGEEEGQADGRQEPERVRVRSTTEEPAHRAAPPTDQPDRAAGSDATEVLGADGTPLPTPAATAFPPADARPAASRGVVVDASVLLVDAVRSYLDGLDRRGADDEVTRDRLDRLRQTLRAWDDSV